jgi:peroxiredoxin
VKNMEKKPFALIGVNVVEHEPKELKEVMSKEKLNWRSLASRDISAKWNAATPTYYLIDHRGVIRNKWVGSPGPKAIDTALEKLIQEAENE